MDNKIEGFPEGVQTIVVPGNGITAPGIAETQEWLRQNLYPVLPEWWRWEWRTDGKDKLRGTFPKRISQYMAIEYEVKLTPDDMNLIGNQVARHCDPETTWYFDFTSHFNWERGDFGDDGSCFWGDRISNKNLMEYNNYQAVRFFSEPKINSYGPKVRNGLARAWVTPIGITPDNRYPGSIIIFNGYAKRGTPLDTRGIGRVLATYFNVYYRWVRIVNHGSATGTLWLNGWRDLNNGGQAAWGMMLGPYDVIGDINFVDFKTRQVRTRGLVACDHCGNQIREQDTYAGPGDTRLRKLLSAHDKALRELWYTSLGNRWHLLL